MSETIEFEARLIFAAHRGCGSVITTWPPGTGEKNISQCQDGRYHVTLTPIEPELKPCPRCGGEMYLIPGEFGTSCYTRCDQCHARGPLCDTYKEAVEAHNARKCPELDPCPHCGEEWRLDRSKKLYSARCRGCDHRTRKYTTLFGLVADVNRRA